MVTTGDDSLFTETSGNSHRGNLRLPLAPSFPTEDEPGGQLRRAGSLRLSRSGETTNDHCNNQDPRQQQQHQQQQHQEQVSATYNFGTWISGSSGVISSGKIDGDTKNLLNVPDDNTKSQKQHQRQQLQPDSSKSSTNFGGGAFLGASLSGKPTRHTRHHSTPAITAPAPEYLARSLLQLGCPVVSMPKPRGGVGSEHLPQQSSESDDSTTSHRHRQMQHGSHSQGQGQVHGQSQGQRGSMDSHGLPKVQVSGPPNSVELSHNGSAGSIGARSAPSTPLQGVAGSPQQQSQQSQQQQQHEHQQQQQQQQQQGGGANPAPKSPGHSATKGNDSQLSKPLSRSTPSMTAGSGTQSPATVSKTSTKSSPTSTSSGRQKKFHRHFSQVAADERVLNYYSCALVGDILLQGHLYITPNYFAFYSNVFGYVTKLLIPTASVLKISKEKTARIIPNAVAVATETERHVFCSLISRDTTFKLMKQVWDAAIEARDSVTEVVPLPVEEKLLEPEPSLANETEVNVQEEESSMSESGTDLTSRPPDACAETDEATPIIPRLSLPTSRLDQIAPPTTDVSPQTKFIDGLRSLIGSELRPSTIIAILVVLLAALYVSAALMMVRIDRLHTAYLNHPLASPERFTHDRLMQYLTSNLDQIIKVRQSLQTLSQQFVMMNQENDAGSSVSGGRAESKEPPS